MTSLSVKNFLEASKFKRFHIGLLLWGLFIISFEGYDLVVFGSVIPSLTKEWGLSPIQAGLMSSYGLFGMMFGSIILSLLADQFGRKPLIITSVIFFSVATFISGCATNATLFSLCRFLAGIGFGGALPSVISLLTEYMPKTNKNKTITLALTGNQVGGILAPLVGMIFLTTSGWRPVLWFSGIPLLFIPFMLKHLPESPIFMLRNGKLDELERTLTKVNPEYRTLMNDNMPEPEMKTGTNKIPFVALFQNKLALTTSLFCIVYFMGLLMIYGLNTWLPKLMQAAGYPLLSSLGFALVLNGGALLGTIVTGVIADKKGSKALITGLYVLGALCLALMGYKSNLFLLYLLIAIAGICTMGNQNLLNAFVSQYYPANVRSTGVGLANGIGRLGGMIGPTMGGMLLSAKAPVIICFIAFALPCVIAALALLGVRKKHEETVVIPPEAELTS